MARCVNLFNNPNDFSIMSKKAVESILVLILFVIIAVASSSASKVSEESAYDFGYGVGRVIRDISN